MEDVIEDEVLTTVFDELTKHDTTVKFVKYLYSELLNTRFMVEQIGDRAVEDAQV